MRRARLLLTLTLIGLWMAPAAGAVVLGVHLAEHHAAHGDDPHHHAAVAGELMAIAVHGHHHSATVPDHEHPASLESTPGPRPGTVSAAFLPRMEAFSLDHRARSVRGTRHRYSGPPPDPIFYAHCSLLL